MERDLLIRYKGEYFGELMFFYDNYYYGNILANRKTMKTIIFDGNISSSLEHLYTIAKRFEHPKEACTDLLSLDKTYVWDLFKEEIARDQLDIRDFNISYGNVLPFSRALYSKEGPILGNMTINVDSQEGLKEFIFMPFHEELEGLRQKIKVPFAKINKQIIYEFIYGQVHNKFPEAYYF